MKIAERILVESELLGAVRELSGVIDILTDLKHLMTVDEWCRYEKVTAYIMEYAIARNRQIIERGEELKKESEL